MTTPRSRPSYRQLAIFASSPSKSLMSAVVRFAAVTTICIVETALRLNLHVGGVFITFPVTVKDFHISQVFVGRRIDGNDTDASLS